MGRAANFKFGQYIHGVHPLQILEKRERGRIQELPKFFSTVLLLSQEGVKLRTVNFVGTFTGSIETKAH